jgi:hypothetical protein
MCTHVIYYTFVHNCTQVLYYTIVHMCTHVLHHTLAHVYSHLRTCTHSHSVFILLHMCTYILYYTHKANGAALSDMILSAAEDEGRGYHYVQIEIMGYCASTGRHLQQIAIHIHSSLHLLSMTSLRSGKFYSSGVYMFLQKRCFLN